MKARMFILIISTVYRLDLLTVVCYKYLYIIEVHVSSGRVWLGLWSTGVKNNSYY